MNLEAGAFVFGKGKFSFDNLLKFEWNRDLKLKTYIILDMLIYI